MSIQEKSIRKTCGPVRVVDDFRIRSNRPSQRYRHCAVYLYPAAALTRPCRSNGGGCMATGVFDAGIYGSSQKG